MSLASCVGVKCVAVAAPPLLSSSLSYQSQAQRHTTHLFTFPSSKRRSADISARVGKGVTLESDFVEQILSGEWPQSFSILNFEDLSAYYEPLVFKPEAQPSTLLAEVMSEHVYTALPEQSLEEIDHHFANISGLPVINEEMKCIGVLSKKDRRRASNGLKSKVHEVMSSPVITLSADKTVLDAAVLMLKNKIHRIPIVNESHRIVGVVTRRDIFKALEEFSL